MHGRGMLGRTPDSRGTASTAAVIDADSCSGVNLSPDMPDKRSLLDPLLRRLASST